jgi:hypothetical protein
VRTQPRIVTCASFGARPESTSTQEVIMAMIAAPVAYQLAKSPSVALVLALGHPRYGGCVHRLRRPQ